MKTVHYYDDKVNELKEQLTVLNDRLEFEVNMYEKRLASVKAGIYARVRRDLQLELDGIENISKRLPNKEADELSRWIANIKQIVDFTK